MSAGKDTTIGHFEIAGIVSDKPLPTYPDGFPEEIIKEFEEQTGCGTLCNNTYSGTDEYVEDNETENIIADLFEDGSSIVVLKGSGDKAVWPW